MKINLNSRDYLHKLEKEAWKASRLKGTNQLWASVYKRLSEVVWELDAYLARSEEKSVRISKKAKTKSQEKVYNLLKENPSITLPEMAKILSKSISTIHQHLVYLKKKGYVINDKYEVPAWRITK